MSERSGYFHARPAKVAADRYIVWLLLTGTTGTIGLYKARILRYPTSPISFGSVVTEANFGKDPLVDNCYAMNEHDIGAASNSIATGSTPRQAMGIFRGIYTDGKPIYAIDLCQ